MDLCASDRELGKYWLKQVRIYFPHAPSSSWVGSPWLARLLLDVLRNQGPVSLVYGVHLQGPKVAVVCLDTSPKFFEGRRGEDKRKSFFYKLLHFSGRQWLFRD